MKNPRRPKRFTLHHDNQMREAERLHFQSGILAAGVARVLSPGDGYRPEFFNATTLLGVCSDSLRQAHELRRQADELEAEAYRRGKPVTVTAKPKERRRQ